MASNILLLNRFASGKMHKLDRTMRCGSALIRQRNTSMHSSRRIIVCARNIGDYSVITACSRRRIRQSGMRSILAKRVAPTHQRRSTGGRRCTMMWVPQYLSIHVAPLLQTRTNRFLLTFTRRWPVAWDFCPAHRNVYPRKWRHSMRVIEAYTADYQTRMNS